MPRGHSRPSSSVRPDRSLVPGVVAIRGRPVQGTRESLSATAPLSLQPRPAGSPSDVAQPLRSLRPKPPSRCTAAAPSTRRSLPRDAAALLLRVARTAFESQPQPPPGFSSYPVTPLVQRGRIGRGRRSGPGSAVEASPGRHFVFRDGRGSRTGATFINCSPPKVPRGRKDC
ncbi:hypothetical protein NDU88_000532 [Pleurodeles waltl]|uniref:Uncharacterized protein n=1 Tax=Pleurodeles waltl TaxID=8319 RepID=A0AAV7TGL4_PLEWA|nr:hypothetical protein NDU88_000532 [Pleurodeles waltl]